MLLIAGSLLGFVLFIALLIFLFRLFSITVFHIPGFDLFFQYVIIIIPYLIFFAAYFYLYKKAILSKSTLSRFIARVLLSAGMLLYLFTFVLSNLAFLSIKNEWLVVYDENSQYAWIVQLVILLIIAAIIAGGDAKEKDWMDRSLP